MYRYVERSGWIIHSGIIIGNNRRDYLRLDDIARNDWEVEDYSDIFNF
jgi:tRNA splicing endonuclease